MAETCNFNHVDHVGLAVKDIDAALALFSGVFGAPPSEVHVLEDQGVRATLIEVGQTRLELLEPLSADSAVGRFIERRGEGLHHLALKRQRHRRQAPGLAGKRYPAGGPRTARGACPARLPSCNPASVFGVLTELVEKDSK